MKTANRDTWEFETDRYGEWRWVRVRADGSIAGAAACGHRERAACVADARRNGYAGG